MRILILQNAASGLGGGSGGGGGGPAAAIASALAGAGHDVERIDAKKGLTHERLMQALGSAGVCIVAGGDGTLHYALPALAASRVPVYHAPCGTENLFARQFGMTRDAASVLRAVATMSTLDVDLGECDGRLYSLMCSIGFDAAIVERVVKIRAARDGGGVSRMDYVRAGWHEFRGSGCATCPPRLRVEVEGQAAGTPSTPAHTRRGMIIVANSPRYAAGLDPARSASMTDGVLDVLVLPHAGRLGIAVWMMLVRLGMHWRWPFRRGLMHMQTAAVRVRVGGSDHVAPALQIDGEAAGRLDAASGDRVLTFRVRAGALRVLLPAG